MRRNLKDHFEAIYLRYNMVEKYLNAADQTILQDIQFKKCVTYMSGLYFNRYRDMLSTYGFEYEDLHSIITIFGLTYWGHASPEARDRKAFMFMMRYIGQRMQTLVRWVSKKFGADEASVITSDDFDFLASLSAYDEYSDEEPDSTTDIVEDEIELIQSMDETDPYRNRAIRTKKVQLTEERRKTLQVKDRKTPLSELRKRLLDNPDKHRERLCYYATSKSVGRDMRTKARSLCKQAGIDYVAWLKSRSGSIDFDTSQFTF